MAGERLVLYVDILGFKQLVSREPLENMVARFDRIYGALGATAVYHEGREAEAVSVLATVERQDVINASGRSGNRFAFEAATQMTLFMMSDSVIVYSKPLSRADQDFIDQLSTILRLARTILFKLLDNNLPSRGALAFGEFHAEPADDIYVGRALVEAYDYAERQDWIGTLVAPSLSSDVEALERASANVEWCNNRGIAVPGFDYLLFDVPVKNDSPDCTSLWCRMARVLLRYSGIGGHCRHEYRTTHRLYVANWATSVYARDFAGSELAATGLRSTPDVARKYENTLSFLDIASRVGFAA